MGTENGDAAVAGGQLADLFCSPAAAEHEYCGGSCHKYEYTGNCSHTASGTCTLHY